MTKLWQYESKKDDNLSKQMSKDETIVFTKPTMAIDLLSTIVFRSTDSVMEPCKGQGAFYDNFPSFVEKHFCEINEGIDYLQFDGMVDITISNPPFVPRKLFWEFHQKAMETTRREIYWLLKLESLNTFTPKRLEEMKTKGWFMNSFHIVQDKRWFGRYSFIKFSREDTNIISWNKTVF